MAHGGGDMAYEVVESMLSWHVVENFVEIKICRWQTYLDDVAPLLVKWQAQYSSMEEWVECQWQQREERASYT